MKDFLILLNLATWNSWKVVYQYCTGTYVIGSGHMAGFGARLEIVISFLFTTIEVLLFIVGFLVFR